MNARIDRAVAARIDRVIDGTASAGEAAELQADVVRDPALRVAYVERVWLEAALRARRDELPEWLGPARPGVSPATGRWVVFGSVATALAACVALAFVAARSPRAPVAAPPPVATLVQTQHAKWAGSTLPTMEQSPLGPGTLALAEGIATVRFASGATVVLEAPARLALVDATLAHLIEGSLTAEVPAAAKGFTIETADLRVVDLGTRFGVTTSTTGNSQVFVFEGAVRLDGMAGAEPKTLTAGKSFHIRSGATTAGALEPARAPVLERIDGWTSIPTSFGRGKDAYARRGHVIAEPQPLLMVKHSDLPLGRTNERRALITFDLGAVATGALSEVELVLDPEPSGMGFSAMVPDARFAVYGVADESLDGWSETNLAWDNALVAGDALETAPVRRLAEFALTRGASGAPLTVRGPALTEFVRADTNGLVTLMIVRETGETAPSGLVHAFASKEHPTARPPTLRVR